MILIFCYSLPRFSFQLIINMDEHEVFPLESEGLWTDRSRTLVVTSRGVTPQQRRFVLELVSMMPHAKKQFKIEKKDIARQINQICKARKCKQFLYFQTRKKTNFQLFAGLYPEGPTLRFLIQDFVDSNSLKLQGNCIKGSRPIISFDAGFDSSPQGRAAKAIFLYAFHVPAYHPLSKPCVDHVFAFNSVQDKFSFRNFQIFRQVQNKRKDIKELYQIGPRFTLRPLVVLAGSMSGQVLFYGQRPVSKKRVWHRRKKGETEEQVLQESQQQLF